MNEKTHKYEQMELCLIRLNNDSRTSDTGLLVNAKDKKHDLSQCDKRRKNCQ